MDEPAADVYVPEAGKVAIKDLDGSVSLVRQADLAAAQGEGARPASEAEYFGAKHGAGGQVASALVGAGRGATFGVFDPAFIEATRAVAGDQQAEEYRNTMRLLKEANPNATLAGEIGGAVAPALFGAPPVEAAGSLGEGLFARGAARVAAAAPRAISEGAAIGLGQQLSEDTLSNHKMVAESYLNAGVKGGAIGLLLGGGVSAGVGAVGDRLGALFGKAEGGAIRAEEAAGTRLGEGGPYRGAATREAETAGEQVGRKSIIQRVEDAGNEQAYKATGANQTDWKRLGVDAEGRAETAQRVGKMLQSETVDGRPLVEATASQEEIARRIATKQKEVAKSFSPMYAEADTAVSRPSVGAIRTGMEDLRAKYATTMYGDLEMRGAEDSFSRLEKSLGENPSHTELWNARKEIDGQLRKAYARDKTTGMVPQGEEAMRALRGVVNDELVASTDRASLELGGTLGDRLRSANQLYGDLQTARSASTRASARGSGNQAVSITDVISMSTGGIGGAALTGLNMVRRKYGNQIAAHVLGTASKMDTLQRAAAKLDDILGSGTKSFIDGSKGATRAVKPVTTAEVRAIREATRAPEAVNARIAEHLGDMPDYAPKTAQQISTTVARAAAWLQHALPKESPPVGPMFNQPKLRPLSDSDLVRARATIETVEDGSIVVDRLRQGRLTAEHVAALKYVHPETYAKIQKYLGDHAVELKPTLTVQQQFSMSMLFGTPITEAMLPENIRAFQASFAEGNQAPGKGGAGGVEPPMMSAGPVNGGGTRAMNMDRMEAGAK